MPIGDRVLFIGGSVEWGSVQVRCQQIADAIGARWTAPDKPGGEWQNGSIPERELDGRDLFVLVKSWRVDRCALRARGRVIWDVLDDWPPYENVDALFVGSKSAERGLTGQLPTYVVPPHHCNLRNRVVAPDRKRGRITWIGSEQWLPKDLVNSSVNVHTILCASAESLESMYGEADLLLNVRRRDEANEKHYVRHTALNPGTKLINAVGFGIPSVTEWEPWVEEVAPGCTAICEPGDGLATAARVLQDDQLYERMRLNCLKTAAAYSIETIAGRYVEALEHVAAGMHLRENEELTWRGRR